MVRCFDHFTQAIEMSNPSATMWEIETMSANSSPDEVQLRSDIHTTSQLGMLQLKWSQFWGIVNLTKQSKKNKTSKCLAKCLAMQQDTRINGSLEFCKQATPDLQLIDQLQRFLENRDDQNICC